MSGPKDEEKDGKGDIWWSKTGVLAKLSQRERLRVTDVDSVNCEGVIYDYMYRFRVDENKYILKGFVASLPDGPGASLDDIRRTAAEKDKYFYREYNFFNYVGGSCPFFVAAVADECKHIVEPISDSVTKCNKVCREMVLECGGTKMTDWTIIKGLTCVELFNVMFQLFAAIQHLHSLGRTHLGLTLEDICYNEKEQLVKITSMGSAGDATTPKKIHEICSVPAGDVPFVDQGYSSPEVLATLGDKRAKKIEFVRSKEDVYRLGRLMYAIVTKRTSQALRERREDRGLGKKEYEEMLKKMEGEMRTCIVTAPINEEAVPFIVQTIVDCLRFRPKDRLSSAEVFKEMANFGRSHKGMITQPTMGDEYRQTLVEGLLALEEPRLVPTSTLKGKIEDEDDKSSEALRSTRSHTAPVAAPTDAERTEQIGKDPAPSSRSPTHEVSEGIRPRPQVVEILPAKNDSMAREAEQKPTNSQVQQNLAKEQPYDTVKFPYKEKYAGKSSMGCKRE